MANTYGIGNGIRISVKFKGVSTGQQVDPEEVGLMIKDPSGEITTLTYLIDQALQKSATGEYFSIVDANEAGTWTYRWEGSGDNQAAVDGSFTITASSF